jgi:lipoprotein-anchoring transpeptidase ErfK/SrfK
MASRNARSRSVAAAAIACLVAASLLLATGCGGDKAAWYGANGKPAPAKPPAVAIAVSTPTDGATDVPPAVEIAYTTDAIATTVELEDATGAKIDGAMRPDKSSWLPGQMLKWGTAYTARITGTAADGRSETKSVRFTTMARPASTAKASSVIADNHVVGVGMPIIVSFSSDIPRDQRAAVQRRLLVTSEPAQEGIWYWWNNREVHFRPKVYWQAGTKISVRAAVGGLPLGGNRYGAADLTLKYSVGSKIIMVADNATKHMTVTKDDQLLRTVPISFGKPSTPSSSGHMIVMIKNPWEMFDSSSFGIPAESSEGYRTKVYWPQRLTWSGQYLHAAPWSEKDQGRRNVSHGCTNVSMANAEWLYKVTQIGDPVIVKGTEQHVAWQNGWTPWDRPWEEFVKGSAIPYTPAGPAEPSAGSPEAGPKPS